MFALLRHAVRSDLDRQLKWAKAQAERQARYVGLTGNSSRDSFLGRARRGYHWVYRP